ncbi:MAG: efflux RND transporter periplasmic adaptor subunit [Prevotella sp.]
MMCFVACTSQTPPQPQGSDYKIAAVTLTNKVVDVSYSATIRGRQDIDIYPQVSGKIVRMCVKEGQQVKCGQPLFVIDQVPYQQAVKTAEADVEMAQAELKNTTLNYENSKSLNEKKVVSNSSLQSAEYAYLSAKARMSQASAQLVKARNDLDYTTVKAPCNGVVGNLPFRVGTLVGPTMTQPLTTVSDNSSMYVYFSMPENSLLSYARNYGSMEKAISAMPELQLRLNDKTIYPKKGRIESISGVIDRQTGSVTVRAVFDNAEGLLHSGASGEVLMPNSYDNCVVIPQSAAVKMQDKTVVYKVVDGKATSALIKVADVDDGREYIVLEGIKKGDEIVTEGAGLIREGTKVK